jgi:CBS domain containing-hemolysin-like protein
MADLAQEEGVFHESESLVIKNVIDFKKMVAKDIMTPRTVIKMANEQMKIREFYDKNPQLKFSRIPIFKESPDDISGYFLKDQLFESIINGQGDKTLQTICRDIYIAARETPIKTLFENLIEKQEHIALIVDEFGSVSGIVTQEDIIETLLGLEIVDESDSDEDLQVLARKLWRIRAKRHGIIDQETPDE